MGTKEQIFNLLNCNDSNYISGEHLADQLNISRSAVWKAISTLRTEGYCIDAVPHKGYRLTKSVDIISKEGITDYLSPLCNNIQLEILQETESTNTLARQYARNGVNEGFVVIANHQTKGKGRRGKSFHSPANAGLYLSLVLRPTTMSIMEATKVTTMAAVAVCRAIEATGGKSAQIKWVNDVFLNNRKVCGILTEASCNIENGSLDYIVLGIGINLYAPSEPLPEFLQSVVGHIFEEQRQNGKNQLAAEFLNQFMTLYQHEYNTNTSTGSQYPKIIGTETTCSNYIDEYRKRCFVLGKPITILSPAGNRNAVALQIDDDCRLLVRYEDGTQEALNSGEISVRVLA